MRAAVAALLLGIGLHVLEAACFVPSTLVMHCPVVPHRASLSHAALLPECVKTKHSSPERRCQRAVGARG
jgi:hypothetical protein